MVLGLGPRFVVQAAFLIAVAVAAAFLSLSTPGVVAVMAAAWPIVAVAEWRASRRASRALPADAHLASGEPPARRPDPPAEPEPLPEPVGPAEPPAVPDADPLDGVPEPLAEPIPPAAEPIDEPEQPEEAEGAPIEEAHGDEPRERNPWDLERAVRDNAGRDPERDEERSYLLMYLREFASPDGSLPPNFDRLVRESFADVLGSGAR